LVNENENENEKVVSKLAIEKR